MQPIPVICDRCRAEGVGGEDPFAAFGALLDFDPVPRKAKRADGWDAELQRAFIALLSLTGSVKAACRALGKSEFGITQLVRAEGCEGFVAAMDEAIAISKDERSRRIAEAVRTVAADKERWRPPEPAWAGAETRRESPEPRRRGPGRPPAQAARPDPTALDMGRAILRTYVAKLAAERRCRLAGRVAEADFYLRQLTFAEVALELATGDAVAALEGLRRGDHDLLIMAETDISRVLDTVRRIHWERCGEPPRPEYPPRQLLVEHDGYATEPLTGPPGGERLGDRERRREEEARFARAAEAQIAWEAEARSDYERRREAEAAAADARQKASPASGEEMQGQSPR
ncbi:MAG: hypothetical protein QOI38_2734 [Sphingomonadales bacterium]|jgi:hypothetical protein|nr:hypothetical protein [Sphingomonadales bacterium]